MKNLRKFFILAIMLSVCILPALINNNKNSNDASAFIRQNFVDWDTERKLIYAYQNNLEIVEDGTGTTVYLVKSPAEKVSLSQLYTASQSSYDVEPPANGADLSDWSIVFGAENYLESQSISDSITLILMTGGKIKNIYAGHSVLDNQTVNYLRGKNTFTITGGEVDTIYTEHGYEESGVVTKAHGSNNITFNLFGGTINKLERSRVQSNGMFKSKINLKDDIKITEPIVYINSKSGNGITIDGTLTNPNKITIELSADFSINDKILDVSQSITTPFDSESIILQNKPANSQNWIMFVLNDELRFGNNQTVISAFYSGIAMVGETLTIEYAPAEATIEKIIWYRENAYLGSDSLIGDGFSYTLKPEDGGKRVYAEVYDKLQATPIIVEIDELIARIDLPEIIIEDGKTFVYANGNDLIIAQDGNGSTIYLDENTIGVLDTEDLSLKDLGIENAYNDGANLSEVIVSAGSSNNKNSGDIAITLAGGKVKKIITSSTNGEKLTEGVVINLFGGMCENIEASKNDVKLHAIVNIMGDVFASINGIQNNNGATEINVVGEITSPLKSVKIILDKSIIDNNDILSSSMAIDLTKFMLIDTSGSEITTFEIITTSSGVKLDAISADSVIIEGEFKVGKTLTAVVTPGNANVIYAWYRNSEKSLEGASLIESATAKTYKLTKDDMDSYIILVVSDEDHSITAYTDKIIIDKNNSNNAIVITVCVISGVLVLSAIIAFIVFKKKKSYKK